MVQVRLFTPCDLERLNEGQTSKIDQNRLKYTFFVTVTCNWNGIEVQQWYKCPQNRINKLSNEKWPEKSINGVNFRKKSYKTYKTAVLFTWSEEILLKKSKGIGINISGALIIYFYGLGALFLGKIRCFIDFSVASFSMNTLKALSDHFYIYSRPIDSIHHHKTGILANFWYLTFIRPWRSNGAKIIIQTMLKAILQVQFMCL